MGSIIRRALLICSPPMLRYLLSLPSQFLVWYDTLLSRSRKSFDGLVRGKALARFMTTERTVSHNGVSLVFCCPSQIAAYRAWSFSEKEPETLDWLDSINGVLWDIGANVGLYSIYFSKKHGAKAFAFEPSVFNLELLARNISRNNADVAILPIALFSSTGISTLRMSTTEHAGALSAFGVDYGGDGLPLRTLFRYDILGMTIDDVVALGIPAPNHVKIDVDGIEHEILRGARKTLGTVQSVLTELNPNFTDQSGEIRRLLTESGFRVAQEVNGPNAHNLIWQR